jgi:hypothetical protein
MGLSTFEEMRRNADKQLGDVEGELRSDWRTGTGPTKDQAAAWHEARSFVDKAKAALDRAGR